MIRKLKSEPYAVLVADMVGYSGWLAEQPLSTHRRFAHHLQRIFAPSVRHHGGRLVKTTGDGFLAIHKLPADAELCAREIHAKIRQEDLGNSGSIPTLEYRFAVHFGPVIEEPNDVFGLAVNAAIHMQTLAQPGGICISNLVFDQLSDNARKRYTYLGRKHLKNLPEAVPVYGNNDTESPPRAVADPHRHRRSFLTPPARLGIAEFDVCTESERGRSLLRFVESALHRGFSRYREFLSLVPLSQTLTTNVLNRRHVRSLIDEQLRLDYVIFGSLITYNDTMAMILYMENSRIGEIVWTGSLELSDDSLRALENRIVHECITPSVFVLQRTEMEGQNHSRSAFESQFQLAQRLLSQGSLESTDHARDVLSGILDRCGDIGNVHVAMARAEHLHGRLLAGQPFVDALNRAHNHATLAIEIDELNPRAHAELALQEMFLKRQPAAAAIYQRALRLNPDDPMLLADWANCLTFMGRSQEALPILESVAAGWPRDRSWVEWNLCDALWALDLPDRILGLLDARSTLPHVHRYLAAANAKLGRASAARHHAEIVHRYQPDFSSKAWSDVVPHTQSDTSEQYVEFLQKAGL